MPTELDTPATAPGATATPPRRLPRWVAPALGVAAFLLVALPLGSIGNRLSEVQRNDSSVYLPDNAEATSVLADNARLTGVESTTAIVVYHSPTGITDTDTRQIILTSAFIGQQFNSRLAGPAIGPILSDDRRVGEVIVPFMGSDPDQIRPAVDWLRSGVLAVPGLDLNVTGPAAAQTDLLEVYGAIDVTLLLVTGLAILLILLVVYRGPILPFLVLCVAGVALGLTNGTAYLLAKAGVITVSGQVQGILNVLVLGAGTDYALLLTARFREELRRRDDPYEAMRVAWRAAVPPIVASGATVILGLLCLLASGLPSTRGLGPVTAIGIAFTLVSMLVLLPAALVLLGRAAFWPFRPAYGSVVAGRAGRWSRMVGRRPRLVWILTVLALGGLALGMTRLQADGVPRTDSFLVTVDSVTGQDVLSDHFPAAAGSPVTVITRADRLDDVARVAGGVPGVAKAVAYVDPLERFLNRQGDRPDPPPKVVNGLSRIDVTLVAPADSPRAVAVVRALRQAVHAVPGAAARVGGYTAGNLDVQDAARRDREKIIPLVLAVVFGVLALLIRAVVAPLLLIGTVILSFFATLGVSGVVFRDVLGFAGADSSLPLYAFVFLVALGVDYTVFLMTRVREETARQGHRAGTLAALTVTAGVITSAGIVLAATFAALAVVPLVLLAELAFAVAFGILLDTLVVRSLLVPALVVDIGRSTWWPNRLRHTADP